MVGITPANIANRPSAANAPAAIHPQRKAGRAADGADTPDKMRKASDGSAIAVGTAPGIGNKLGRTEAAAAIAPDNEDGFKRQLPGPTLRHPGAARVSHMCLCVRNQPRAILETPAPLVP